MASVRLSKSKYLNGLQCPKYLWMLFHDPERIPEPDAGTQRIFDQGHMVGELAKKLFPSGIDIEADDFIANIRQTEELFQQRKTLFEAGILAGNIFARADILNPTGGDEWDLIEVKSATKVKDINVHDVSFQKLCCQRLGLKIRKCFLTYINNEYVKDGEIDPEQLFSTEDITARVEAVSSGMQDRIDAMFEIISEEECPDISIGKQCSDPYDCPLKEVCWDFLPENNVFDLYGAGNISFNLIQDGVLAIKDIPDGFKLSEKQQIQKDCELSADCYTNQEGIKRFLQTLRYPLYYLDFETFSPAVPMFDGTKPYKRIPFQFSLHVVEEENSRPKHFAFLAEGTDDPRPKFLSELKKVLGDKGSIVVYNQAFEKGVLKELSEAFSGYSDWVDDVLGRIIDLLTPFRSFHYYHPLQRGSASIKKVLPALTGWSYEGMDISNGEDASVAFQEVTYGDVPEELRSKVRENLAKYCELDTRGMVEIVDKLKEL